MGFSQVRHRLDGVMKEVGDGGSGIIKFALRAMSSWSLFPPLLSLLRFLICGNVI